MGRVLSGESNLVSIVLVTWNSGPFLARCLDGIAGQRHVPLELIAVDNASSDDSVTRLFRVADRVVRNETNRGFSVAVNQGVGLARGEFVLLLNPDCFMTPEYISRLVAVLREKGDDAGAATGMLVRARGEGIEATTEIDSLGIRMTRSGRHLDLAQGRPVASAPEQRFEVFGVSGAAAMLRRTMIDDLSDDGQLLDEDFFAYREDADLAWRARLRGWRAYCDPSAVAYHVRRVTPEARRALPPEINMHSVKNRFLLRLKNEGSYLALRNAPFELARDLVVLGAALTIEWSSLPALGWLWRNRRTIAAKRRSVQKSRRVSDRVLARWFR